MSSTQERSNVITANELQAELDSLRNLRRRSLSQSAEGQIDPDLPNQGPPSPSSSTSPTSPDGSRSPTSPHDDPDSDMPLSGQVSSLFWLPARLHPELAPQQFRSFIKEQTTPEALARRTASVKRSSSLRSDASGTGTGASAQDGAHVSRRKSMLSQQVDPATLGESDESTSKAGSRKKPNRSNSSLEEVPQRAQTLNDKSRGGLKRRGTQLDNLTIADLHKLEQLSQAARSGAPRGEEQLMQTLLERSMSMSVLDANRASGGRSASSSSGAEEAPLNVPAPGSILRRSAISKIRKPSLLGDGGEHRFGPPRRPSRRTSDTSWDGSDSNEGHATPPLPTISAPSIAENHQDTTAPIERRKPQASPLKLDTQNLPSSSSTQQQGLTPEHKRSVSGDSFLDAYLNPSPVDNRSTWPNAHSPSMETADDAQEELDDKDPFSLDTSPQPVSAPPEPTGWSQPDSYEQQQQHQEDRHHASSASPPSVPSSSAPAPPPGAAAVSASPSSSVALPIGASPVHGQQQHYQAQQQPSAPPLGPSSSSAPSPSAPAPAPSTSANKEKPEKEKKSAWARFGLGKVASSIKDDSSDVDDNASIHSNSSSSSKKSKRKQKSANQDQNVEDKDKEKEGGSSSGFFGGLFSSSSKKRQEAQEPAPQQQIILPTSSGCLRGGMQVNFFRLPIHVERAVYRLSHIKLANPRRALYEQVLISNLMFWYLSIINRINIPPPQSGLTSAEVLAMVNAMPDSRGAPNPVAPLDLPTADGQAQQQQQQRHHQPQQPTLMQQQAYMQQQRMQHHQQEQEQQHTADARSEDEASEPDFESTQDVPLHAVSSSQHAARPAPQRHAESFRLMRGSSGRGDQNHEESASAPPSLPEHSVAPSSHPDEAQRGYAMPKPEPATQAAANAALAARPRRGASLRANQQQNLQPFPRPQSNEHNVGDDRHSSRNRSEHVVV